MMLEFISTWAKVKNQIFLFLFHLETKNKSLGLFRVDGQKVSLIFPNNSKNYIQKNLDETSLIDNPNLLSDNLEYFKENFEDLNLTTRFRPITTNNLLKGDAHKILKLKLDFEKNEFDERRNDFQFGSKKRKINKMASDFNNVLIRKQNFPQANYWGAEYDNYDPVIHQYTIQRGMDKIKKLDDFMS